MNTDVVIEQTNNKHSRAVFKNNTIIIRLAKRLSTNEQKKHIEHLFNSMQKRVQKIPKRTAIKPFSMFNDAQIAHIPLTNDAVLTVTLRLGEKQRFRITDSYTINGVYTSTTRPNVSKKLWQLLSICSAEFFTGEVQKLNQETYNVAVQKISIAYKTSAWGSMSTAGHLRINPALLFVPKHLRNYVLIHELAHGLEPNHSKKFWKQVEKFVPNYRECRKELQLYELPKL